LRLPIVVLDELVALVVSVMLTLTLRHGQITLMQLHAVALDVHIVLAYVGLRSLRWVLRSLPVVSAVLVGSRSASTGHLGAVKGGGVGHLICSCPVLVRVRTLTWILPLVLWIVVVRAASCALRRHSVSSIPLMLLVRVLVTHHCRILGLLPTNERAVGESR